MNKKTKNAAGAILATVLAVVQLFGCGGKSTVDEAKRFNLLMDPTYATGFEVDSPGVPVYDDLDKEGFYAYPFSGELDYNKTAKGTGPLWNVAQHSSGYSLVDPKYRTPAVKDGTYVYSDPAKTLAINPETGAITLAIDGAKEYSSDDDNDGIRDGVNLLPRKGNESWVHLLLTSTLYPKVTFGEIDKIEFEIDMTMNKCDNVLEERGMADQFNPVAHAAQITMYFMVYSNAAADQGKYFWFGVSMFDARYETQKPSAAFDAGSNSMMIGSGTEVILSEPVRIGKKYEIRYDMLADMKKGLETCHEYGILTNTTIDDLYLCDFNLGWELPGIYDVSVSFENFGVYATYKQN